MEESSGDGAIETLRSRGWCFGDLEQVKAMILIHSALADDTRTVVNSVEAELTNMDLKSICAKSLPDPITLRKSSHLLGPKVLQISWVRDITRSNVDDFARNSSRRLLKLGLTDGHSETAAIEYSYIPSIPDGVVPGTKVRLENKAVIRNGIVCLNPKVLTVLGGVVQSLYEEWQMNKKYSGFSRSTLRLSKESDGNGPPPFEKLQVGAPKTQFPRQDNSYHSDVNTKSSDHPAFRYSEIRPTGKQQNFHQKSNDIDNRNDVDGNLRTDSVDERTEEKPSSSATRPKEVVEAAPVQNQAAAQKLLQKMSTQNQDSRYSRGRKFRGKGKQEESEVFTLEEWEKRKAGAKPSITASSSDVRRDEELAWQLQNQFDLEDSHVQTGPQNVEAESIKLSMFNYEKNDDWGRGWEDGNRGYEMEHERSGRGRGWGSGREDDDGGYGMEHGRSRRGRGWGRREDDYDGGYGKEHRRSGRGWGRREDDGGVYGMEHGRSRRGR